MTTPNFADVMPYGVTFIPSAASGTYLVVDTKAGSKIFGTTGVIVPTGVFNIVIHSRLSGAVGLRINYNDGSPTTTIEAIKAGGGSYNVTLSGENINYLQLTCATQSADMAAGRRATMQILPIPNPT